MRDCLCMPLLLYEAKCRGFCKLGYYAPSKKESVENHLIYHIKRSNDAKTFSFLAAQLSFGISKLLYDERISLENCLVTYVPRSRRAILREGLDQSKELAGCLAEQLEVERRTLVVRNSKCNIPQKELTPEEREKNAQNAFVPLTDERVCRGKTVLLVDDVVTTGATMARCVRILRKMGAARVYCVAAASDNVNRYRGAQARE